jgi:hypothetical protein
MYKRTGEYNQTVIGKYVDYIKARDNQHFILIENITHFVRRPDTYKNVVRLYDILAENSTTKVLRKYIPDVILEEKATADLCLFALSVILETKTFLEIIGYKNEEMLLLTLQNMQIYSEKDIIFLVRNLHKPAIVMKYFVKLIN